MITPRQVKGLRTRYSGSGAKSDAGDAYLLADVLRTDGHRLAALERDSDATAVLRALSRTRKDLVEARVGLVNQLLAQLERVFPGAIGLFARLDSDVAIAFLRRYPTLWGSRTSSGSNYTACWYSLISPPRTWVRRTSPAPTRGSRCTSAAIGEC